MNDRGRDWGVRIVEGNTAAFLDVSYQCVRRSFEIHPGESVDLRIAYTKMEGPQVLFMRHAPDSTK